MRLTTPQRELLEEIRASGGLYIRRYSRYGQTVLALQRRGFVRIDQHDYSMLAMDHWVAV